MIPWRHLIGIGSLAMCAVGIRALPPEKKPYEYPPNATNAEKQELDLLRTQGGTADPAMQKKLLAVFPFESLEARLAFDLPGRKRLAKSLPAADLELDKWKPLYQTAERSKIPPAALDALMTDEKINREGYFDRVQALATLHQLEVQKFVTNPGFGFTRLSRSSYKTTEKPPTDWSEGDRGESVDLPKAGGYFNPSQEKTGPTLPSTSVLASFHSSTTYEFTRPDSWGLVTDKTRVAGFQPHALEFFPEAHARRRLDQENPIKDKAGKIVGYPLIERWAVRKLELIGLLMHDSPVVYSNPDSKLPTMAALKDVKTRELTEFESAGLKDLATGKEVAIVDATTNQVRMIGAIRMASACLKCHEGRRGDLLGAFTYDLVRDPSFVRSEK